MMRNQQMSSYQAYPEAFKAPRLSRLGAFPRVDSDFAESGKILFL